MPPLYDYLFASFAFILGASIGSFLNVCIYRMPRELSVNQPKRSFCPSCQYAIPFYHNIPLFSWLFLRGKCANCHTRIAFRYFGVELLTALLFLAVWLKVSASAGTTSPNHTLLLVLPYAVMSALFIVATFIDFEHFIIPDEITIGGTIVGVLFSFAIPILHSQSSPIHGGLLGLLGAAVGYSALWLVVQFGKLAFGKKRLTYPTPQPLSWIRRDEEADFTIGDESMLWSEFFYRGNEQILLNCSTITIDGQSFENVPVRCTSDWIHLATQKWELNQLTEFHGRVTAVTLPREAMGLGDVKFIACIGAFLGWQAVAFTIMSASVFGSVIGLLTLLIGRREWSTRIPFGPYLALGALLWLFSGPELVHWYWQLTLPPIQ